MVSTLEARQSSPRTQVVRSGWQHQGRPTSRFGLGRLRAAEERAETQTAAFGQRSKDTRNTSDSRLATVKLTEGAEKAKRPATGQSGGLNAFGAIQSVPTPVNHELHRAWHARQLQRLWRFLPIG
jgi:hypothetical protein